MKVPQLDPRRRVALAGAAATLLVVVAIVVVVVARPDRPRVQVRAAGEASTSWDAQVPLRFAAVAPTTVSSPAISPTTVAESTSVPAPMPTTTTTIAY
jgi:hypothetical protein